MSSSGKRGVHGRTIACPSGTRQTKPATLNPGGEGGAPSRLSWAHGPMTGLSAGGLLAASCQKQGGMEGVLY